MKNIISLDAEYFLKTNLNKKEIIELINNQIKGNIDHHYIKTTYLNISIEDNEMHNQELDFIGWPYLLEVSFLDKKGKLNETINGVIFNNITKRTSIEYKIFITETIELNNIFKKNNISYVISCDFEEEYT